MLSAEELVALVRRVFRVGPADKRLAVLCDLPDAAAPDHLAWRSRRETARSWAELLRSRAGELGLEEVTLWLYPNVHADNADLPPRLFACRDGPLPPRAELLTGYGTPLETVLSTHQVFLAPTQFSTTAPLKNAARTHLFRGATMPGFAAVMIPALRLDYGKIAARVKALKVLLDDAQQADFTFHALGRELRLVLDLRYRSAHESSGLFPEPGQVGNLPSGETYIVPYEGERAGDPTRSAGELPVELKGEVVVYRVAGNRAVQVVTDGPVSRQEAARLAAEPAYGNMAELGLGVLDDFGLDPTGIVLLDEKLGLHIAFGRSDHFGGQVGPAQFTSRDKVVHIDRVYIPKLQPQVQVREVVLTTASGQKTPLMKDGRYVVRFPE
jgi:hypothetical protein